MTFRIGQTWRDRRRNALSTFTVLKIYTRRYSNGDSALRVKGVLVCGVDAVGTHLRDLDARSAEKMFPVLTFDPPKETEEVAK